MRFLCFLLALNGSAICESIWLEARSDLVITRTGPVAGDLRIAADLLAQYLLRVLHKESLKGSGSRIDFEIEAGAQIWHQLPADKRRSLGDIDSFEIRIDSVAHRVHIHGSTVQSACFGVLEFLERHVGVTWLFPGELGLALPDTDKFELKTSNLRIQPDVTSRLYTGMLYPEEKTMLGFRQHFQRDHPLYTQRVFFEAHDYFKSLKLHFLASPSHNMINVVTTEMAKTSPEMAPLQEGGKRFQPPAGRASAGSSQAWHPCYSNPKVRAVAIEKARQAFEKGDMCYSLGINDGYRVQCQCDECKAEGWPMSYYNFVTQVAEALKDKFSGHVLGVLVYGDVRSPPDEMRLPENVLCMVTGASELAKWSKHASNIGRYGYFFGQGFDIPSFPLRSLKQNARVFKKFNVRSFRAEVYPVWAFDGPKVYIQSKQLWDLSADADELLARWCRAAFGEGGPAVQKFYLHWASKWDYLAEQRGPDEPAPLCDMGMWRSSSAQFARMSPDDFSKTSAHLSKAQEKVKPGKQEERLAMVRTHFEYSRTLFETHHAVQTIFSGEARGDDLRALVSGLYADYKRSQEIDKKIKSNVEWSLGAGQQSELDLYKTIEHEIHSGMLTAALGMRKPNRPVKLPQTGELPELILPLATTKLSERPLQSIKVMSTGWYYAMADKQYLFEPMKVTTSDNELRAVKDLPTPTIKEGSTAGEFEQHWSFVLIPWSPKRDTRHLFRFDFEANGAKGRLLIMISNPRLAVLGDGLPMNAAVDFGEDYVSKKRTIVVEPVTPKSRWYGYQEATAIRFGMLFTPMAEDANCEIVVRLTEISFPHAGEDESPNIEDFLNE
ncbi:MAG: DUF4838 domain-containing protein [Planctomycetota bacterium]|nr:DUF4838 domain-containing protein [Planctomycetota bacterium]